MKVILIVLSLVLSCQAWTGTNGNKCIIKPNYDQNADESGKLDMEIVEFYLCDQCNAELAKEKSTRVSNVDNFK